MAMQIDGVSAQSGRSIASWERGGGRHVSGAGSSFSAELSDQQGNMTREELERLLKEIDEAGARLTNTPTYDELKEYRTLVREFVSQAVGQMYALKTSAGWDRLGRQKVYTTVKRIDEELESMAEHIRLGQSDSLSIVASQDAIRGMLVDLYS